MKNAQIKRFWLTNKIQKEEKKIKIIMLTKIRLYFVLKKEQNSADKCL